MSKETILSFVNEEKKKGIISTRYPHEFVCAHNSNKGVYVNREIIENDLTTNTIDGIKLVTDITGMTLDGLKTMLSLCRYLTMRKYKYKKEFCKKYNFIDCKEVKRNKKLKAEVANILIDNYTCISITYEEILSLMEKNINRNSKKRLCDGLKLSIKDFVNGFKTSVIVNEGEREEEINFCHLMQAKIRTKEEEIVFKVSDLFLYYMYNDGNYVMLQYTKELLDCKSLGIMNFAMYIVSFKYNNRKNKLYNNVVGVDTMLKKLGKRYKDYENFKTNDFVRTLKRTFKSTLEKIDKDATFELNTRGAKTIAAIIDKGSFTYDIPIFNNGRAKYNDLKSSLEIKDMISNNEELPFENNT